MSISWNIFGYFTLESWHLYYLSIIVTIIAVVVSTRYTLNNIFRIWGAGKVTPESAHKQDESEEEVQETDDPDFIAKADDISVQERGAGGDADRVVVDDPVQYCEHIQSEVKKAKQRVATREIQESLTAEQLQEEREVQRQQLEAIFKLMAEQKDKFGVENVDEIQQQMSLYA